MVWWRREGGRCVVVWWAREEVNLVFASDHERISCRSLLASISVWIREFVRL